MMDFSEVVESVKRVVSDERVRIVTRLLDMADVEHGEHQRAREGGAEISAAVHRSRECALREAAVAIGKDRP